MLRSAEYGFHKVPQKYGPQHKYLLSIPVNHLLEICYLSLIRNRVRFFLDKFSSILQYKFSDLKETEKDTPDLPDSRQQIYLQRAHCCSCQTSVTLIQHHYFGLKIRYHLLNQRGYTISNSILVVFSTKQIFFKPSYSINRINFRILTAIYLRYTWFNCC